MYFLLSFILVISLWLLMKKRISNQFNFRNANVTSYISALIFLSSTILCVFLYFKYDKERSAYGLNCVFCSKSMPFGINPKSGNYADGLVLVDDSDFELVGMGFKYRETNFKMGHFLAYGYNDTSIIVKCTDSLKNVKYLISYKTGYKSKKGNDEVSFKELNIVGFRQIKKNYHWIELDEGQMQSLTIKRFISLVGVFIFFFLLFITLIKLIKAKFN